MFPSLHAVTVMCCSIWHVLHTCGTLQASPQRCALEPLTGASATSSVSGDARAAVVVMLPGCPTGSTLPPSTWIGVLSVTPACKQNMELKTCLVHCHSDSTSSAVMLF